MKTALYSLAALVLAALSPVAAVAQSFVAYAYLPSAALLYNAAGEEICALPATYFVVLCGDEQNGKFPVSYLDLSGYVSADTVETVDYEPVTKFPSLTARPRNDGMAVNLREIPDSETGKILAAVPHSATLTLYGARTGSELFAGAGNVWQYVRYNSPTGAALYGYIYSAQLSCDAVMPNVIEKVPRPSAEADETQPSLSVTRAGNIALAAAMCVPAGFIMLILFYRPDSQRTPRHKNPT